MNIVYGFGGLKSDREILSINPMIIDNWTYYSFKINYHGSTLKIKVDQDFVKIKNFGNKIKIKVYEELYEIVDELVVELKNV